MINVPMNPRNTKRTAPPKQMGSLVRLFLGFRLDPYTRISLEGHDAFGVLYRFCHIYYIVSESVYVQFALTA